VHAGAHEAERRHDRCQRRKKRHLQLGQRRPARHGGVGVIEASHQVQQAERRHEDGEKAEQNSPAMLGFRGHERESRQSAGACRHASAQPTRPIALVAKQDFSF
jgi:hypothetical protein